DAEMNHTDWMEDPKYLPPFEVSSDVEKFKIELRSKHFSSGLSPDCSSVFFLGKETVTIYSLCNIPEVGREVLSETTSPSRKNAYATITNRFLAIIADEGLTVFQYTPSVHSERGIRSLSLGT